MGVLAVRFQWWGGGWIGYVYRCLLSNYNFKIPPFYDTDCGMRSPCLWVFLWQVAGALVLHSSFLAWRGNIDDLKRRA